MNRKETIGALCGMVLGDAHIGIPGKGKNAYLSMRHCSAQEDYLGYKAKIISQTCGVKTARDDRGENGGVRLWTKCHPVFTKLHNWFYENGKKVITTKILCHLNPLGLAIWYMDDGYLAFIKKKGKIRGREIKIYTQGFTKEENEKIVEYFERKYGIKWRVGKTRLNGRELFHIATGAEEGKKFLKLIAPYIHPSMNYKADMKYTYSSYAGRPFKWSMIQSELGSNVKTVAEMPTA